MKTGPLYGSLFVYIVLFAGAILAMLAAVIPAPVRYDWLTFAALAVLVLLAQIFDLFTLPDDHQMHGTTVIFFFAGVLLLHPLLFVLLVLIPYAVIWVKERMAGDDGGKFRYQQPLQAAIHVIAGLSSGAVFAVINPDPAELISPLAILGVSAAAITYDLFYQALSGLASILADKVTVQESGLFAVEQLLTGFVMLCLGVVVSVLWRLSPWLILPALAQLVLIYRALKIPYLRQQAQIDIKTGLWTARHFNTLFAAEVKRAVRFGRPMALVMTDLDFLRVINNTYGHLAGDAVLASVGQTLREALREYDIAGRFGGEEFAIVLPETAETEAFVIAERIRQAVATTPIRVPTSRTPIHVTMSLGIACFPEGGQTALELMHRADVAVYYAKFKGRNRVVTGSDVATALIQSGGHLRLGTNPFNISDLNTSGPGVQRAFDRFDDSRLMMRIGTFFPPFVRLARRFSLASVLASLLLTCVLLLGAVGAAGAAAREALPGETLYSLKIAFEGAQMAFATTNAERARLDLTFAQNRLDEANALASKGRYPDVPNALTSYEQYMQRANDALESIPTQDYAGRVLVASFQQESLAASEAALNSLLGVSPPTLKPKVARAIGETQDNISAARQAIADAALSFRATPTETLAPTDTPSAPTEAQVAVATALPAPNPTEPQTVPPTLVAPPTPSGGEQPAATEPNETPTRSSQFVLWSADMETGDLSQWATPGSLLAANHGGGVFDEQSGNVSVTDQIAHTGRYSIEMTIYDGAGIDQAVRIFRWYENPVQAYYSVWYYFPQRFTPKSWWNIMQFKSKTAYPKDTLWVLNVGNRPSGEMYLYLFDWQQRKDYEQTVGDIPVGRWVHVEVLYRRSTSKNGRVAVWQDGALLFDLGSVQTTTGGDVQWSVDNYTDQISPSPATIYADDAMITTRRVGP